MPPGSSDKPQQSMGSGFPGSSLYPNKNIWTSSLSNARERSNGHKDSEGSPSGSSALAANSKADVWSSNPWKTDQNPTRSVSTSPNRTRDSVIANSSKFYEHPPSTIGMKKKTSFGSSKPPFQEDASMYGSAFAPPKRQGTDSSFMDSLGAYPQAHDSSLPPSRQSQGSPAFQDLYHRHTPNNSIHSQRAIVGNHAPPYATTHSVNQRAFNLNNQIDEDLATQFSRRVAMDHSSNGVAGGFGNPEPQPFRLNPGSQPWMSNASGPRHAGPLELTTEGLPAQSNVINRGSMDRVSPASDYRLQGGNSPRTYGSSPDAWSVRNFTRDPRIHELERRSAAAPHFPGPYDPYYANQFAYQHLPTQFAQNFINIYGPGNQAFRHNLIPATYNMAPVPSQYALAATNLPPIRPSRNQDPGRGVRSILLDEFRLSSKSNKKYELKDIYDHVVEFSGDQHGSRFIQQKLESANSDEKDQVFREIEPNAIQLMKDVFGNYVVQKFFEHGNQVQKRVLAERMRGRVVDLSIQVYACRVVQKALEHVLVEQQAELTRELEPEIMRVVRDQNGNHVVQKVIELVPRQYIGFIIDAVQGQVTGLASHTYGCRVIQRMLENGTEADRTKIMTELHASAQTLITDQYGNYVAQHVIRNGKPADRVQMINLVLTQLLTLSKHKFASNVVEKCIEYGTTEQRTAVREQLTTVSSDGSSPLQQMMRDQYGNYVIQKLLVQLQGCEREMLVEEIKPQFFIMQKSGTSRQLTALEKLLGLSSGTPSAKNDGSVGQIDGNSAADTPALTNETSSPQSSSPRSAHISTVGIPTEDGKKIQVDQLSAGVNAQLREEEA